MHGLNKNIKWDDIKDECIPKEKQITRMEQWLNVNTDIENDLH